MKGLDQLRLLKRMSWATLQQEERRRQGLGVSPAEMELCAGKARRCLEYIACVNWYLCGVEEDLVSAGMFRHKVKHTVRSAQHIAGHVHQEAWLMLNGYKQGVGRIYAARLQKMQEALDSAVLVDGASRNYSIVCGLLRITADLTADLRKHDWDFHYAHELVSVLSLLRTLPLEDMQLDSIILVSMKEV